MFSRRLPWDQPPNELSRLLADKRAAGASIVDLTESNPTRAGIAYPESEILAALADRRALVYDPSPRGLACARQAIAADCARRGDAVDPDDLFLVASTSEAYAFLFKLLCDPGDAVLTPQPSYPLFDFLTALEGIEAIPYPLAWDGVWHVDFPALEEALARAPRARAILVVHPNNPTGSYLKRDELLRLEALCAARGLALVSDEVFADYPADDTPAPDRAGLVATPGRACLAFSLGGLSKSCGLPQLKLAWIVVGGPDGLRAAAREGLDTIVDSYLPASTPVQLAAPRLLELGSAVRAQILARVRRNRATLVARLEGEAAAAEILPAEGGWYAILRFSRTRTDEELALALLREANVYVHPGYFFDLPPNKTYLVLGLLVPPERFHDGIDAILRV